MSTLKTQFDLHTRLFNNVTTGIEDTFADSRANDHVNHIKWLAGHLLNTRLGMNKFGGLEPDNSMEDLFGRGNGIDTSKSYPSMATIKAKWEAISAPIANGLANLPAEVLAAPSPANVPVEDNTMNGFLSFLMHHEAYHIGQIGILRKYIGQEAMSYA